MNIITRRHSLANQLTNRVSVLSLIAISGLLIALVAGLITTLLLSQQELSRAGANAARSFDVFLSSLETDLQATADNLPNSTSFVDVTRTALQREPAIFELSVINAEGKLLSQRQRVGANHTDIITVQPWLSIVQSGQVYVGPISSAEFGVPFIDIAVPVHDATGSFSASLVAKIDLTTLWSKVTAIRIGTSGYAYITDAQGLLLAYHDLNLVHNKVRMADFSGQGSDQLPKGLVNGSLLSLYTGASERPVVGISVPLTVVPWYTVVEQPIDEALQGFIPVFVVLAIVFALLVWLVTNIGRFTQRKIVRPILTLRDNVDIIRHDDLKQRIVLDNTDENEISVLASAFNDMLERIEMRTQELIVANKLTKESTRLKSEFMATMSHELRTPLNAMLGFSGILLSGMEGEIDERASHMIERIESNSQRLLGLINDILDIAKIEAGRLELVTAPLNLNTLAHQWKNQMSVLAKQKQLAFEVNADPTLPMLYGDGERISQIAINLLSNAFKFTEQGRVTMALKRDGSSWLIEVADTGIGIPPQAVNYIFDEFRQVDGSSRRVYGGSGLGLAIVRNLCRTMDGTVRVASVVGKGSTFTVTLPLNPVVESQKEIA